MASRRLVQPQPKHYVQRTRDDGQIEDVLVGCYTLEQRSRYFKTMIGLYMTRHPEAKFAEAQKSTFQKWRNLVLASIGDEYVPVKDHKKAKDAVELSMERVSGEALETLVNSKGEHKPHKRNGEVV